jgi:hypothetical protein
VTGDLGWLSGGRRPEVLAEIHATVDLERALAAAGVDPGLAATAVEDELLGARVVIVDALGGTASAVAVAEPSTEGRLARTLAQHDEGSAGHYLRAPMPLDEAARRAAAAGVVLSRPGNGPFGRQVLVLRGSPAGLHVLLVEPRTVPSPR